LTIYNRVFSIHSEQMMEMSLLIWQSIELLMPQVKSPSLHMTACELSKLTFDQAEKMKRKVLDISIINNLFLFIYNIILQYIYL